MRVAFIVALFLAIAPSAYGLVVTETCAGTGALNATNFTSLSPSSNTPWDVAVRSSGKCVPTTVGGHSMVRTNGSFSTDQIIEMVAPALDAGDFTGPLLRLDSSGNGIQWLLNAQTLYIVANGAGIGGTGISCPVYTPGDTLRFSVLGTTYTCLDVTTGLSGSGTDSTYATGNPGFQIWQGFSPNTSAVSNLVIKDYSSLAISPAFIATSSTGNVITLTGVNTSWTPGTPGAPTFTLAAGPTITAQTVASTTSAAITVNAGGTPGSYTVTDPTTGDTATLLVHSPTTSYIDHIGGDRYSASKPLGLCDGTVDAAPVGTTPNQHCAWNDIRYAWATGAFASSVGCPDYCWALLPSDTLMVKDCIQYTSPGVPNPGTSGPCRIGYSGPNSGDYFLAVAGNPGASGAPPPPNGVSILGVNYGACSSPSSKALIRAGYGAGAGFETAGSTNVTYRCLDVSDQSPCGRAGLANQCATSYPLDDYANNGFDFYKTTTGLTIQDVSVHGMASDDFHGPAGGGAHLSFITLGGASDSTWNADPGDGTTGDGDLTVSFLTITGSGCNEEYPIVDAMPYFFCSDQSSSGYGDGFGTTTAPSTVGWHVLFDHVTCRYTTQDCLDMLHVNGGTSTVKITNSIAYGAMGQQMKIGGSPPTMINNFAYSNPNAMRFPITGFPPAITISSYTIVTNTACFVTSTQSLVAGQDIAISGFGTSTFFNGANLLAVSATGLTSTTYCVPFTHANASATEAGVTTTWNGYLSNFARAGDQAIAVTLSDNYTSIFQFNTVVSANTIGWFMTCADTCNHPVVKYQDNVFLGYLNDAAHGYITGGSSGNFPDQINFDPSVVQGLGVFTNSGSLFNYNDTFNTKFGCPLTNEANYLCVDPVLTNETWTNTAFSVSTPASGASPIVGTGLTISGVTTDQNGLTRPNPPSIGAYEFMSAPPSTVVPRRGGGVVIQ